MRAVAVLVLVGLGCDGGSSAAQDGGPPDAARPDVITPIGSSTLRGRLVDGVQTSYQLEGARVSVVGTSLSAVSDERGEWEIQGAPEGSMVLHFDLEDYFPQASRVITVGEGVVYDYEGYGIVGMVSESIVLYYADLLGVTLEPDRGHIVANVGHADGGPLAGASLSVVGTTCDPPVYVNEESAPDPSLTATSSRGLVTFFNCDVVAGASVEVTHATATTCAGLGADAPAPLVINLYASRMTYAGTYLCDEP